MAEKIRKGLSYTQLIALSFIGVILVGSLLLCLPAASRAHQWTPYVDSLFTATSATCVTGLIVFDTYLYWSLFGRIVILCLIQIGGLGFMTVISMVSIVLRRRIGLKERRLLMESTGSISISGIVALIKRVFLGTLICEGTGAIVLAISFWDKMPPASAIFSAIFHSVSAFCNAGFDLMGQFSAFSSLTTFADDPVVLITIMLLIIIGGIGFFVWSDIARNGLHFSRYQTHTKAVLTVTAVLIFGGALLFFIFEYNHAFAGMSFGEKILSAFFQSVTPRTAGFNTVDLNSLSDSGALLTMTLMFIGGSPGSTAGGVKTTTILVLFAGIVSAAKHRQDVVLFKRRLEEGSLNKACSIITIYLAGILCSTMLLCCFEPFGLRQSLFEVVSAAGTVGLSCGLTPQLGTVSHLILILLMFGGRIGGLTLALILAERREIVPINRPTDKLMIG